MKRKFFFFDIDGTLAVGTPGNQYIPESTKLAISKLKEAGHFLAIATGRSYAMAVDYMRQLGFENMVSDGGNGITIANELIEIEPLNYKKCLALINECIEKNYIWAISPDNSKRRLTPDKRFLNFTHDNYMETIVQEDLDPRNFNEIYKVYVACFAPEEQKLQNLKYLPWCRFHKEYIFVEPDDKSIGIKKIVDYFNGDYQDVVVFGDEKNDLKMFKDEWISIAMGNAVDELKQKADYVTNDCNKDGIYNACKYFGWID